MVDKRNPKVLFIGSKLAGEINLKYLLFHNKDHGIKAIITVDDQEESRTRFKEIKKLAHSRKIPLFLASTSSELVDIINRFKPEIVFVNGWYKIIPKELICKIDFFAFHFSLLPAYRGNAPLVWQMINGEEILGITLFRMNSDIDSGDIIDQQSFTVDRNATIRNALNQAHQAMEIVLERSLESIYNKSYQVKPQTNSGISYCGKRVPSDGLINWDQDCNIVHNFIRAQVNPYPGAYSYDQKGNKVIMLKSEIEKFPCFGVPGSVIISCKDFLTVACSKGAVRIYDIEIDGLSNANELNRFKIGARFSSHTQNN